MATLSSILDCEIPWTEEPGGLQSMGSQESDTTEGLNHHSTLKALSTGAFLEFIGSDLSFFCILIVTINNIMCCNIRSDNCT